MRAQQIACALSLMIGTMLPGAWALAQGVEQNQQATYTNGQAEAGSTVYSQACADCHLADLRGSFEAPELSGPSFRGIWVSRLVSDLLDLIQETMPPENPRSLTTEQVTAVAAYLLRENGIPPGDTYLSFASLGHAIA